MRKNKIYFLLIILSFIGCTKENESVKEQPETSESEPVTEQPETSESEPVVEPTETNTWTEKAKFPGGPLSAAVSFSIGNKLYVGTGTHNTFEENFFVYNNNDNSWKPIKSLPSNARANAISFSIGNYGYVGLGYGCIGERLCTTEYYNDLWRYDPEKNNWAKMNDFPGTARASSTCFVINDKAYVTGGSTYGDNDLWEYNSSTNVWTKKADYPGGCSSRSASFSIDNKGYVGFGWWGYTCKDFWEYDPQTDTWLEKAEFPGEARFGAVALSLNGKGYLSTGVNQGTTKNYLTDLWKYDPVNDGWTQINTDYPGEGRLEMIAGVISNKIIIGLGTNDTTGGPFDRFDDVWEYIPE